VTGRNSRYAAYRNHRSYTSTRLHARRCKPQNFPIPTASVHEDSLGLNNKNPLEPAEISK